MGQDSKGRFPFPVGPDLERAHRDAWRRLSRPGTWWTGRQRVALVAETRASPDCPLCRDAGESPDRPQGHSANADLPGEAVEVAHRVRLAPGRITRHWCEAMVASLGDALYAEAVAVVAATVDLDVFHQAMGLPVLGLPTGEPGVPSRKRPRRLSSRAGWLPMARSREMRPGTFGGAWTPNVCRALSLVPRETEALRRLIEAQYVPFEQVPNFNWRPPSALSRPQMELLALRVSSSNECFY